jgi:hypothetical protein
MAQLCWRRLYLAVCLAEQKKVIKPPNADEVLRKHLVWFAALEGSMLYIGAVCGGKLEVATAFKAGQVTCTGEYAFNYSHIEINISNDTSKAVKAMYDLFHNHVFSESLHEIIRVCSEARIERQEMERMEENFREAVSVSVSSKPLTSSNSRKRRRSWSDRESDEHSGPPSNRQGRQQQPGQPFQGGHNQPLPARGNKTRDCD